MREQLIDWLLHEAIPDIKRSGDPESVLLKMAGEKSMTPGQLEAMGQLFNTAKTLSYIDKSASKGASFPIVDVPAMLDKYITVKQANAPVIGAIELDAPELESDVAAGLPECFSGFLTPDVRRTKEVEQPLTFKQASQAVDVRKLEVEIAEQARFEAEEDARDVMRQLEVGIRKRAECTFESVERDAIHCYGMAIKPVMDKAASYLKRSGLPLARAKDGGPARLARDPDGFMPKIAQLREHLERMAVASEVLHDLDLQVKSASADFFKIGHGAAAAVAKDPKTVVRPRRHTIPEGGIGNNMPQPLNSTEGPSASGSGKDNPRAEEPDDALGTVSSLAGKGVDFASQAGKALSPVLDIPMRGLNAAKPYLIKNWNEDQQHVDKSFNDTHQLAILHDLMTRDDVLAEADPEKIVSIFNTVRAHAPSLASDANVLRTVLRSGVQHDGISPFDLKSFLDTELSKQKVDAGRRTADDRAYGNKPPASSSKKDKDE